MKLTHPSFYSPSRLYNLLYPFIIIQRSAQNVIDLKLFQLPTDNNNNNNNIFGLLINSVLIIHPRSSTSRYPVQTPINKFRFFFWIFIYHILCPDRLFFTRRRGTSTPAMVLSRRYSPRGPSMSRSRVVIAIMIKLKNKMIISIDTARIGVGIVFVIKTLTGGQPAPTVPPDTIILYYRGKKKRLLFFFFCIR